MLRFLSTGMMKRTFVFSYDVVMIIFAWLGSYWLRFNLETIPDVILHRAIDMLPIVLFIQTVLYWQFGLYRGLWRFASMPDLLRIIKAVSAACCLSALVLYLLTHLQEIPRSVFPMYGVLLIGLLGGSRMLFRLLKHKQFLFSNAQRVLIVGAGRAGESLARELLRQVPLKYKPIVFVDDASEKKGQDIHGIRIMGTSSDIPMLVQRYSIELIFIAVPSASAKHMRHMMQACEKTGAAVRTLPGLNDIADGFITVNALREVSLEDLLGRAPVTLDWEKIKEGMANKTVLVSGGGGSIGSELCRQIAQLEPETLIVIEQNEANLYHLEMEMRQSFPRLVFQGYLADVTDRMAVRSILSRHQPTILFHAAAYKHVPLLEGQPRIAVWNNIIGTRCLAEEAILHRVESFVLISTDKAVNPTNVMGATKRVAEIFCQNLNAQAATRFVTVRFGNVLGSAGSVVPLFRKQIEAGGPVTVTHPDITRFFMTIPEASQLILQAATMATGGEIFVLDMGEPVKIRYLAEQMIRLSGRQPGEDIEIQYTGLRPGEKLYEEIFHEHEQLSPTEHEKILRASYRKYNWDVLKKAMDDLLAACFTLENTQQLYLLLYQLVPEFEHQTKADISLDSSTLSKSKLIADPSVV